MFFPKRFVRDAVFLLITGLVFFFLRFPSLYEPYWYGDEGIYFTIGQALRAGRELYSGIWDNKPPLLYWFYMLFNDLFSIRFFSLLFGLGAVISFFFLSRRLFPSKYTVYLTTSLFALLLALPTIEGNIANAENFMLFPVTAAAFLFWSARSASHTRRNRLLLCSGLALGIAFSIKTVALFDFTAFLLSAFMLHSEKSHSLLRRARTTVAPYIPYLTGFLLPLILIGLFFLLKGILPEFLETIFLGNASYVGEKNSFIIPQGYLLIKLLLLTLSLAVIYRLREKLSPETIFISLWVAFSLFNAYFSQRPYVHYQLVLLPALSLLAGLILTLSPLKKQAVATAVLVVILSMLYTTFPHWHTTKILPYYGNFVSFLTGEKSVSEYRTFFDRNTPRDYALADYLRLHTEPNEAIFLWGDSAQIYYLSRTLPAGRYAVSYHITRKDSVQETASALRRQTPKLLLILPGTEPLPFTISDYTYKLTIAETMIYERLN